MSTVSMPRLSDSMEEGTIVRWLVGDGESVTRGQEIVEIETDKATMAFEADADGRLTIAAAAGSTLAVGAPIATIGDGAPVGGAASSASPVAARLADELGVDLASIAGTGPQGRVVKADVLRAAEAAPSVAPPPPVPQAQPVPAEPVSRVQQVVARRMEEAHATIPDFAIDIEVDMSPVLALRDELRAAGLEPLPSINDVIVKLVAIALRGAPRANASYRDGRFVLHDRVNVGIAVASADALVVPTVFDADRLSLADIARQTRALAARVRDGTVTPPELGGGTFTVSNLGMFGVGAFAGIVNPPQAAILCVGAVQPRAVVVDGEVVARPTCHLTLVSDHRILYGADAAGFLAALRALVARPVAALAR
jgi:pyruvate dehydrogenase E2 component (dihydrolipoamide acetyltransferase)